MTPRSVLSALAFHLPANVVTNDDLGRENPDWDMSRIESKVGVRQRHVAAASECSSDLAFAAACRLFEATGVDPAVIDTLLFCTQSPDYFLPTTACVLQDRLGLGTHVAALDFNQGCSGYVYGLFLARALIDSGSARNVLLLNGETYSRMIHPRDRTVRVLFGDAGSATLISAKGPGAALGPARLGTDGSGFGNLIVPAGAFRQPRDAASARTHVDSLGCERAADHLFMDGQAITAFAMSRVPDLVHAVLDDAGLKIADVDWFVFHQANAFMNERLRLRLGIPVEKMPLAMRDYGNTVGNTLPIVLHEHGSRFRASDRVLLVGFGVGYSWGAMLLDWGDVALV
jgi:3-oxoacyl-[acyl-carrier-protein] synthase-3